MDTYVLIQNMTSAFNFYQAAILTLVTPAPLLS
jgi:hypothetical protein